MRSRRSILGVGLVLTFAYAGLNKIETTEVATLRAQPMGRQEYYAQVFIVDDPPHAWIRADRPDRLWLESVRKHPEVSVERAGQTFHFNARVLEGARVPDYVDALFRQKYGLIDPITGFLSRRDPVRIRLERR